MNGSAEHVDYETRLFVQKELDILGSRNATPVDFQAVIRILAAGKFPVDDVIWKVSHMEEVAPVFSDCNRNPAAFTKILVDVGDSELGKTAEPGHRPAGLRDEVEDNEDQLHFESGTQIQPLRAIIHRRP